MRRIGLLVFLVAVGCSKKNDKEEGAAPDEPAAVSEAARVARTPTKIDGPSVSPVITNNITFVAPKAGVTWAEMAFPCYKAAIELQPGSSVTAPFYQTSPMIEPALKAAGIDLEHDFAAIGGWDCDGEACVYIAVRLRDPAKLGELVKMIAPEAEQPEPLHWSFEAPGATGMRNIHIRAVPIQWGSEVPSDAWSAAAANATHVLFVTGVMGGADVDPLAQLATGDAAKQRVANAEGVTKDARNRCVVGTTGASAFKPGFDLESSRFAMVLPPAKNDPIARMMAIQKSLNVEVELTLSKPAAETDVKGWIEEARQWVSGIAAPLRLQFAAQGDMVDVLFDAAALIATEGFRHELDGKRLRLSWRTDRVEQSSLDKLEADLQRVMGL